MKHIDSLSSLRFFGALSVIALHLGSYSFFKSVGISKYHVLVDGSTGVQLFYVLSGFLLTVLAMRELDGSGVFSFTQFFMRRAIRLFPLYYLALLMLFILDYFGVVSISSSSFVYALLYSYNFVPKSEYHGLLGSFHTLGTEEHFYFFFALLIAFVSWCRVRFYKEILFLVFLILSVSLIEFRSIFAQYEQYYYVGRWTLFAVQPILIGCASGVVFSSHTFKRNVDSIVSSKWKSLCASYILLIGFFGCYFYQVQVKDTFVLSVGFVCLIYFLSIFQCTLTSRVLSHPLLVYLGSVSYGLYVWQSVFNGTGSASRWIASPYISTCLVFVFSFLSYELMERPLLRFKARFR